MLREVLLCWATLWLERAGCQYQQDEEFQYEEEYQTGRQDGSLLQGQFLQQFQQPQQQQLEPQAEVVADPPVPVVIRGVQLGNQDEQADRNKPAFSFDNDTKMNLDGPGYALSLLLLGEIVILAMAFFVGGLGFSGRSLSSSVWGGPAAETDPGHGPLHWPVNWLADLTNLQQTEYL